MGTEVIRSDLQVTGTATIPTVYGSSAASGTLTLKGTSNPTVGTVQIGALSAYTQTNGFLGLGTLTPAQRLDVQSGAIRFSYVTALSAAGVSFASGAAGVNTAGVHSIKVTAINALGETELGTVSPNYTVATNEQYTASNIPVSSDITVTGRNIWICKAGAPTTWYRAAASPCIADNTTTTFVINVADAGLTTAGSSLINLTSGFIYAGSTKILNCDSSGWWVLGGTGTTTISGYNLICLGSSGLAFRDPANAITRAVVNSSGIGSLGAVPASGETFAMLGSSSAKVSMQRHTTADTAGNNLTINAAGCTASATNKNGGILYLLPGVGTGSGMSSVRIQRYGRQAASTTDNTASDAICYMSTKTLTHDTDTQLFTVSCPDGAMAGGYILYSVCCTNGTDHEVHQGKVQYAFIRKGSTVTATITDEDATETVNVKSHGGAGMTESWTILDGYATNIQTIRAKFTSSMAGTPVYTCYYSVANNSLQTITQI